jgi:RNA polymerase sigma factor (sigma-70 family)
MAPDNELLARWLKTGSEKDFGELVQRHLGMVHSAALRVVNGDQHLAEDVTQTVFADLARKARTLRDRPSLAGWLHTSARYAAMTHLRGEHRRRQREQEAHAMPTDPSTDAFDWSDLQPVIDDAVGDLSTKDREALLLRYFENRSHREIGEILGLSDNAARMRVERALDKVRRLLAKRGVTSSASGLAAALLAHTTLGTASLTAAQITATAVTASAAVGSGFTLLHLMTATQLKTGLAAVAIVAGLSVPIVVQHRAIDGLESKNAAMAEQIQRIVLVEADNARLRGEAVDRAELEALRLEHEELLRLRREAASATKALEESRLALSRATNAARSESIAPTEEEERAKLIGRVYQDLNIQRAQLRRLGGDWVKLHWAASRLVSGTEQAEVIGAVLLEREAELKERLAVVSVIYSQLSAARGNKPITVTARPEMLEPVSLLPSAATNHRETLLLYREPTVVSDPSGGFRRLYWFADGHSEEVVQSHRDFSAWERSHGAR